MLNFDATKNNYIEEVYEEFNLPVNSNNSLFTSDINRGSIRGSFSIKINIADCGEESLDDRFDVYTTNSAGVCKHISIDRSIGCIIITSSNIKNIELTLIGYSGSYNISFKGTITYEGH